MEAKYTVDLSDHLLVTMLQTLCRRDPTYPSDWINSVYYDTADLALLNEKVQSEYHKQKLRLRWYGNVTDSSQKVTAYLECKHKIGIQRVKARRPVEIRSNLLVLGQESLHDLTPLGNSAGELGLAPVSGLFPMIVIRYYRHRFTDPVSGARIALDSGIRYTKVNSAFFPDTGPRTLRHGVLEIKSNTGDLPPAIMAIRSRINIRDSFSKYEECWNMYASTSYRRQLTSSRYD